MKRLLLIPGTLVLSVTAAFSAVIYSGYQNVAIPLDSTGVYLKLDTVNGTPAFSEPVNFDTEAWINPFFGGTKIGTGAFLRPVVASGGTVFSEQIVNLATGTTVDAVSLLAVGVNGSETHTGAGANQFALGAGGNGLGTPGNIGFKFGANYGWVNVTLNNTGAGAVRDWAYDNAGGSIVVGRVTQSAPIANTQTFTLSPGTGESFTLGSAITNTGGNVNSLIKNGLGTTILSSSHSFTGSTSITSGTLELAGGSSLSATSSISLNGGTLLFSGAAGNRINDSAGVTLTSGVLITGGLSESLGALSHTATSVIDMGAANSVLTFSNLNPGSNWSGSLSIINWTGTPRVAGGTDQLLFTAGTSNLNSGQLATINFYSGNSGGSALGGGGAVFMGSELVPVPEPTALGGAFALFGLIAWQERRRRRADLSSAPENIHSSE